MDFIECAQLLYLYGVDLDVNELKTGYLIKDNSQDDRKMTLFAVEITVE